MRCDALADASLASQASHDRRGCCLAASGTLAWATIQAAHGRPVRGSSPTLRPTSP